MTRDTITPAAGEHDATVAATLAAGGQLEQLQGQVAAMQGLLVRMLQEAVQAEARLGPDYAGQLVEANAQLVLTALASRTQAVEAELALQAVVQASGLDDLTGLPTRSTLQASFELAVARAKSDASRFALLFLDLDNFKQINDSRGHAFGDRVLEAIAARLVASVGETDTVSRHGGDEFLLLLTGPAMPGTARAVADALIVAVGAPVSVDGETVGLTASVGIAIYPDDGESLDALVARADDAMYAAKRRVPVNPVGIRADLERRNADLGEANERLLVAALTALEMQSAAEEVRHRQAAFLATVAEEMRNPAAPIRIAAAMLGRAPVCAPLLPRVQGIVERQLGQMSRLLASLVVGATAGSGSPQAASGLVDMGRAIDSAVAAIRPAMERRHQQLTVQRPPGELLVRGDAVRLEQVVSNLLDNASKFTLDEGRVSLSVATGSDTLAVTVTDDGIGITPAMLPYIFDPFVQDAQGLGFNGVGLGIGLTVARKLARAHGGDVIGHSAGARRGSQFVLTLPLPGHGLVTGDAVPGAVGAGENRGVAP